MTTPTLFGTPIGQAHDALDRFYTPDALADIIVAGVASRTPDPRVILEPSVGGGAFARACRRRWPGAHIIGVDIDPQAEGFAHVNEAHVGDWPTLASDLRADLVIGNPPFSTQTKAERLRLRAHIAAAREAAPVAALILPWANFCLLDLAPVMRERGPARMDSIEPRPWPANVRETAVYEWRADAPAGPVAGFLPRWR